MRTDIRGFHPEEFGLPAGGRRGTTGDHPTFPEPLLTAGVELAGAEVSLDSRRVPVRAWSRTGPARACSSAAWTGW